MISLRKALGVLAVAAVAASPVMAQGQRGGGMQMFGGAMGVSQLVRNDSVQKELKLSEEQVTKVNEVSREIGEKMRDEMAKLRDLDMSERMEKMREIQKTTNDETKKALADVLKPEQHKRLRQIEVQVAGLAAFTMPEVAEKLKLTDEQKKSIKEITDDVGAETRTMMQDAFGGGGGFDREKMQEIQKKIAALRKESFNKGASLLNDEQKTAWKDMTGTSFEIKIDPNAFGGFKKKKDK